MSPSARWTRPVAIVAGIFGLMTIVSGGLVLFGPPEAQAAAGAEPVAVALRLVQQGVEPRDWKPMPDVGKGVREIRIRDEAGAFRVFYVVESGDAVYVLHAFQKKTQRTSKQDLDKGKARYKLIP